MRQLKILGLALVAIFALGITASSAFAAALLPDVHCLSSEEKVCYPLHLNFADNGKTVAKLETSGGGLLENQAGVSVLLRSTELSGLGSFSTTYLGVIKGNTKNVPPKARRQAKQ